MSVTPIPAQVAGRKKNSNLPTSSGVPSPTDTNHAILPQLKAVTAQMAEMNTRLDEMQRTIHGLERRVDGDPDATGSGPVELWIDPISHISPTAEGHNALARLYNKGLRCGNNAIMPLHNSRNKPILGFPSTLGDLAHINPTTKSHLCKAFALNSDPNALLNFCGVDIERVRILTLHYFNGESWP